MLFEDSSPHFCCCAICDPQSTAAVFVSSWLGWRQCKLFHPAVQGRHRPAVAGLALGVASSLRSCSLHSPPACWLQKAVRKYPLLAAPRSVPLAHSFLSSLPCSFGSLPLKFRGLCSRPGVVEKGVVVFAAWPVAVAPCSPFGDFHCSTILGVCGRTFGTRSNLPWRVPWAVAPATPACASLRSPAAQRHSLF